MASGPDRTDWYNAGRDGSAPPSPHSENLNAADQWREGREQRQRDREAEEAFKELIDRSDPYRSQR